MKRFSLLIFINLLVLSILVGSSVNFVHAAANSPVSEACQGIGLVSGGGSCGDNGTQLKTVIGVIVNLLSAIVGIAAVIMVIVAGLKFITSGGNPQSVAGARNTLLYAIIGLVLVALAQVIVHFVLNQV